MKSPVRVVNLALFWDTTFYTYDALAQKRLLTDDHNIFLHAPVVYDDNTGALDNSAGDNKRFRKLPDNKQLLQVCNAGDDTCCKSTAFRSGNFVHLPERLPTPAAPVIAKTISFS
ncbi:MAG TPA: hypothetical protein VF421_16825 [Niabella sp.]